MSEARRRLQQAVPHTVTFFASALILVIAVPAFMSDVQLHNAHLVRWNAERGGQLDQRALREAAIAYENSVRAWDADPKSWQRSAVLTMLAALESGQDGELGIARDQLIKAGKRIPADGATWTRLVYLDILKGRLDEATFAKWRMSLLTSRMEFDEMRIRLWIGLLRWRDLPPDLQSSLAYSGAALWRAGGAGQKVLAHVYSRLPTTARARIAYVLPNGDENVPVIEGLAARLAQSDNL